MGNVDNLLFKNNSIKVANRFIAKLKNIAEKITNKIHPKPAIYIWFNILLSNLLI